MHCSGCVYFQLSHMMYSRHLNKLSWTSQLPELIVLTIQRVCGHDLMYEILPCHVN